jgi:hypothetical protein
MPSQQPSVQYPCSIRATSVHNQFLIEAGAKVMIAKGDRSRFAAAVTAPALGQPENKDEKNPSFHTVGSILARLQGQMTREITPRSKGFT